MELKEITALAELMARTQLTSLELSEEGSTLKLERRSEAVAATVVPAVPMAATSGLSSALAAAAAPAQPQGEGILVRSPLVGVFYSAATPDAKPYVEVGDKVKKGDVLCIIEAMKLMNEITSEYDGTVAEICVGNGQVVEFDQPLFRLD